jgi:hypothetical protein
MLTAGLVGMVNFIDRRSNLLVFGKHDGESLMNLLVVSPLIEAVC